MADQVARFLGNYEHGLDGNGRMVLPQRFRDQLGERGGVLAKLDGCLGLWNEAGFDEMADVLEDAVEDAESEADKQRSLAALRAFLGDAAIVMPDRHGRIIIPADLRAYARLESQALLRGIRRRAEIWNPDTWAALAADADAAASHQVGALGITGRRSPR